MLPSLAIRESDLAQSSASAPTQSGHSVNKVHFTEPTGLNGLGFLKYCDSSYDPLRAKYNVARSVFYRSTLGERASEERLVYDLDCKIVGTVSVAIPNFIPLQKSPPAKVSPKNKLNLELANPTTHILIRENVAELLMASYRHKNDDVHPDNISLAGVIDFDMCGEENTALKDERITSGLLHRSQAYSNIYSPGDIDNFPILVSDKTHWPTHPTPLNGNVYKKFNSFQSFRDLKSCPRFEEQKYVAALKELLSFQFSPLKKRLDARIGNKTRLDLNGLPPSEDGENIRKQHLISLMGEESFYKKNKQERTFNEHFMLHMKKQHSAFYDLLTGRPKFSEFIHNNPGAYQDVRDFFEAENEKYPPDQQYNLEQMDADYTKIIRDSMRPSIFQLLNRTEDLVKSIKSDIFCHGYFSDRRSKKTKSKSVCETLDNKNNDLSSKIAEKLEKLLQELQQCSAQLFAKSRKNIDINSEFMTQVSQLLTDTHESIKTIIQDPLSVDFNFKDKTKYTSLMTDWKNILGYLAPQSSKEVASYTTSTLFKYSDLSKAPQIDLSKPLPNNIDSTISDLLFDWLKETSVSDMSINITIALKEYTPRRTLTSLFWSSPRTDSIETFRKQAEDNRDRTAFNLVKNILTTKESGWELYSFNTLLIRTLLVKMLPTACGDFSNTGNYSALAQFNAMINDDNFLYPHILNIKNELFRKFSEASLDPASAVLA